MANYEEPSAYRNTLVLLKSQCSKLCFLVGLLSYFACVEFSFAGESNVLRNKGSNETSSISSDVARVAALPHHLHKYEGGGKHVVRQPLDYHINTSILSSSTRGGARLDAIQNIRSYYSLSLFQYFILVTACVFIAAVIARTRLKMFFHKGDNTNYDLASEGKEILGVYPRRSRRALVKQYKSRGAMQGMYSHIVAPLRTNGRGPNVAQTEEVRILASSRAHYDAGRYRSLPTRHIQALKVGVGSSGPTLLTYVLKKAVGVMRRGKEANANPLHITHDIGYKALVAAQTNPDVAQLIDCLLEYFYLKKVPFLACEIDMNYLARESFNELSMLAASSLLKCEIKTMPMVMGDRLLLRQVWINLIGNALKFASESRPTLIEVGGYSNNAENIYYVKDNGIGFDEKRQALMFHGYSESSEETMFHRSVGLAIVYCIVKHHGGRVWATSRMEEGTVFYFSIPIRSLPSEGKQ